MLDPTIRFENGDVMIICNHCLSEVGRIPLEELYQLYRENYNNVDYCDYCYEQFDAKEEHPLLLCKEGDVLGFIHSEQISGWTELTKPRGAYVRNVGVIHWEVKVNAKR